MIWSLDDNDDDDDVGGLAMIRVFISALCIGGFTASLPVWREAKEIDLKMKCDALIIIFFVFAAAHFTNGPAMAICRKKVSANTQFTVRHVCIQYVWGLSL